MVIEDILEGIGIGLLIVSGLMVLFNLYLEFIM